MKSPDAVRTSRMFNKKRLAWTSTSLLILSISAVAIFHASGVPFVKRISGWSIGIYIGDSPTSLVQGASVSNPVLTAADVTDCPADYVADPFMILQGKTWHIFFEVKRSDTHKGEIATASSQDGQKWIYQGIVLAEPFHLSYPYVFRSGDDYYMIPETVASRAIRLYRATNFPSGWAFVANILDHVDLVDPCIFTAKGTWWLLAASKDNAFMYLYYADDLMGPWTAHPQNPVIRGNKHLARGGGRIIVLNGMTLRYAQDDSSSYGAAVWVLRITDLSRTSYHEDEVSDFPLLTSGGSGWRAQGMHNVDPHEISPHHWIACVDGYGRVLKFSLSR